MLKYKTFLSPLLLGQVSATVNQSQSSSKDVTKVSASSVTYPAEVQNSSSEQKVNCFKSILFHLLKFYFLVFSFTNLVLMNYGGWVLAKKNDFSLGKKKSQFSFITNVVWH